MCTSFLSETDLQTGNVEVYLPGCSIYEAAEALTQRGIDLNSPSGQNTLEFARRGRTTPHNWAVGIEFDVNGKRINN